MPAPTAPLKKPTEQAAPVASVAVPETAQDEDVLIEGGGDWKEPTSGVLQAPVAANPDGMEIDEESRPQFAPAKDVAQIHRIETRKVPIPPHRFTPLKQNWPRIYPALVEHLKLQVRMNLKSKSVELRTSKSTTDQGALQKGEDFVKAFTLGFDVEDAIALLRLDDLYISTFEIKDVKTLNGDHLARAIGRIAGKDGKTKFAIESESYPRRWIRCREMSTDNKQQMLAGRELCWQTPRFTFSVGLRISTLLVRVLFLWYVHLRTTAHIRH